MVAGAAVLGAYGGYRATKGGAEAAAADIYVSGDSAWGDNTATPWTTYIVLAIVGIIVFFIIWKFVLKK